MIFDTYEKLTIDGKEYRLRFPVEKVARLESELRNGNLILTVMNMQNPDVLISAGDFYALVKHALLGGGDVSADDIPQLFLAAKYELDDQAVIKAVVNALQKSGWIGKPKKAQAAKA